MSLVVVVFKESRLKVDVKYAGGLLNPRKQYYVERMQGNRNPFNKLSQRRAALEKAK